jgi:tetratricopeptide (TPR) repeat protein
MFDYLRRSPFTDIFAAVLLAVSVGLGSPKLAKAQQSQNWKWCENKDKTFPADLAIGGCTALIQSGTENQKNLAIAFMNRGLAYRQLKNDYERAIQDYTQSIKLDPNYDRPYDARCYARAVLNQLQLALAETRGCIVRLIYINELRAVQLTI